MSRVYASLPLTGGPTGRLGREVLRGAQLALERADASAEVVPLLAVVTGELMWDLSGPT